MENDKYVVFKSEDWSAFEGAFDATTQNREPRLTPMLPMPLMDAVVIRKQDVFAAPGLYGYAASIQTAIEVAQRLDPSSLTEEEQWRLEALRDFFFEQGHEAAEHSPKKIPD
jgi:hypothetical protein